MSHTPKCVTTGYVFKRYLNAKRPRDPSGPVPPSYGLTVFLGSNLPIPPETVNGYATELRADWAEFLSPGYEVLTFETYAAGFEAMSFPVPATFTINATDLTIPNPTDIFDDPYYDSATRYIVADVNGLGRYNTTTGGTNFLNNMVTTDDSIPESNAAFYFDPPISFFGAYFTDIGDFTGNLTLRLTAVDDSFTEYALSGGGETDGRLLFFGFVDGLQTYKQITFICDVGVVEGYGMDDVAYGPYSLLVTP